MKAIAGFLVLLFVGLACWDTPVTAVPQLAWTNGNATTIHDVPFETGASTHCYGHIENVLIAEWNSVNSACMNGGGSLNVGYFYSGGNYLGLVGLPFTNDVHIVDGLCGGIYCRYSPDSDMLVTTGQTDSGISDVVVYLHVSTRIRRIQSSPTLVRYVFDGSNPDYTVADNLGQYFASQAFGISDNGKWIVVELRTKGLALVNTETLSIRQIATGGFTYGQGMDPAEELAVSNDGTSVALSGINVGLRVYDITPECGQDFVGDLSPQSGRNECVWTDLGIWWIPSGLSYGEHPRFSSGGHELELIVHTLSRETRLITYLEGGASAEPKIKLLALGDSFTSGEGETDMKSYEPGTDDLFDTCHVSTRSYPFLIGRALGIGDSDVKSVACAGATIKDSIGSNDLYWGEHDRLGISGLNFSTTVKNIAQETAIDTFQPGRSLQSSFVERYIPGIVTVGIGGNDTGLMGKLSSCAMPGTCEWAQGDGLRETAGEIRKLFDTLSAFYYQLFQMSPDTKFYAVGYPDVIDADGVCDPVTTILLDHSERVFIEESLKYINQIIHAAAQNEGFTYLDVEHSLDGKRLCDGLNSTAMNGLRFGGDISVISALPMLKVIGSGTFHPTPIGHALIADAILAGHPNLQPDAVCTDCSTNAPTIDPPPYWGNQDGSNRQSYVTNFVQQIGTDAYQLGIELPAGALQALSSATVEIHSDPISLGTFTATSDGGVVGRVTIPKDVEHGYHTIHVYGTNQEGISVDLYQFIVVGQDGQVLGVSEDGDMVTPFAVATGGGSVEKSGNPEVLGAQDASSVGAVVRSVLSKPIQYVERSVNTGVVFWVVVIAGILAFMSVVCVILLLRRWAKPGS